jgi:hypothetical protein
MADKPALPPAAYCRQHLRIERFVERQDYTPPSRAVTTKASGKERFSHGTKLSAELELAFAAAQHMLQQRDGTVAEGDAGVYVEIVADANKLLPETAWQQKGIRIAAVRTDDNGTQVGGLFVPRDAEQFLQDTLVDYTAGGGTDAAKQRFEKIDRMVPGTLATLWVDRRPLPEPGQSIWWECWCWKDRHGHLAGPAGKLGLRVSEQRLIFPDCVVIPVYGTREDIEGLLLHTDAVEKLRHASDTPHVFLHEMAAEQVPLVRDLAARVTPAPVSAPAACILDSGTNRGHPLLSGSLAKDDQHAVDANWGVDDHYRDGHGTQMAGLALLGDLTHPVADNRTITLTHRLETVTLLPPDGFKPTEPANYGFVSQQAISLPEIQAPERARAFCMAVTNLNVPGDRPTSWSAAMDQAAIGRMQGEADDPTAPKRLIMISGGNVQDDQQRIDPDTLAMEDPVQAWNPLGIGGFTDRDTVSAPYAGYRPIAAVGDRSPYSRTSTAWPDTMPIKPEVVFEAGNRAVSPGGSDIVSQLPSLSVLTTNRDFVVDPLAAFWATSAATAEATRFATAVMAAHPQLWPETVRGLLVHSARWTPAMQKHIAGAKKRKAAHIALARRFGYGVPGLERALASASSDLALIAEATIQPFFGPTKPGKRRTPVSAGSPKFKDIHIYGLPWPVRALEQLGEKRVELKITLSYFIEPSPGQYMPVTPARYRSHGLRFDLQRRLESQADFLARINGLAAASDEAEVDASGDDDTDVAVEIESEADSGWMFGANSRASKSPGSLHCDVWQGTGADLAARKTVAVYPVSGWWKYRTPQKRFNSKARYALIMTLRCLDEEIDLYSEIATGIAARAKAPIKV